MSNNKIPNEPFWTYNHDMGCWMKTPKGYKPSQPPGDDMVQVGDDRVGIDIGWETDYIKKEDDNNV